MKEIFLAKLQYKYEKAKDKFKMLCHLEDFMIQYWEVLKENKQLKIQISAREEVCNRLESNWNKLKEYIKTEIPEDAFIDTEWFVSILDKMQELEGSNE